MTAPLLVAALELTDAIDSVKHWHEALIKYLKDEREYVKDKVRMHILLQNLEGMIYNDSYYDVLGDLKSVTDEITTFAKEEGYK